MDRRYRYYAVKTTALVLAGAAVGAVFLMVGDSWWQLLTAGALGVLLAHFGFLGHDAAHRQIFATGPATRGPRCWSAPWSPG